MKRLPFKIIDTQTAIKAMELGLLRIDEHPEWSNTRYEVACRCMTEFALEYIFHTPSIINPQVARGDLFHKMINKLLVVDEKTGLLVPGYSSYSAFVNSAVRDWRYQYVRTGMSQDSQIEWASKAQRYGKWYRGDIANIAGMIYSRFLSEEQRLCSELEIHGIEVEGVKLMGKIDELRLKISDGKEKLVVRDHKSGFRGYDDQSYLANNTQMTFYLLCLHNALQVPNSPIVALCPEKLKRFIGMSLEDFMQNTAIEIHRLVEHRRMIGKDYVPIDHVPITGVYPYEPPRQMQDFRELVYGIKSKEDALKRREFISSRNKCGSCFKKKCCRNFDMQEIFKDEAKRRYPLFEQADLFASSQSIISVTQRPKIKKARLQKTMRFKKEPTQK